MKIDQVAALEGKAGSLASGPKKQISVVFETSGDGFETLPPARASHFVMQVARM
jgi:hypothetical protein